MPVAFLPGELAGAQVRVRFAWGANLAADPTTWVFTDVTTDVRFDPVLTVAPMGRGDWASQAQPAGCTFRLDNTTGAYSKGPASVNYPNVRANTPLQVQISLNGGGTWVTRFQGEATSFTPRWDANGRIPTVVVKANGILRRLGGGRKPRPLRSPLYRAVQALAPTAFWPLSDGSGAVAAAEANGRAPLTPVEGTVVFGQTGPAGAEGAAEIVNTLTATANVKSVGAAGWTVAVWVKVAAATGAWATTFARWQTDSATWNTFYLVASGPTLGPLVSLWFRAGDGSTHEFIITSGVDINDGRWHLIEVNVTQVTGTQISLNGWLDGVLLLFGTASTYVIGKVTSAQLGYTPYSSHAAIDSTLVSALAVWDSVITPGLYQAGLGFVGETATARLTRLCTEQGVPISITGTSTTAMGAQGVDTFLNLVRECEAADLGFLYDGLGPGLGYITRAAKYNRAAAVALNVGTADIVDPFEPEDDDQLTVNIATVRRKNGGEATFEDATGPKGTAAIGDNDTGPTVNVAADAALRDIAAWLVHQGTVDEAYRYPKLSVDFKSRPSLLSSWLPSALPGARVDVLNVATAALQHPTGDIALMLEGYTEQLTPQSHRIDATCSPFQPWRVDTVEDAGNPDRVDTDGSTLNGAQTATSLSWSVATAGTFPIWTTIGGDFPFDIDVEGERVTVTAISGASSPQTFTVVRGIGGVSKAHPSAAPVKLWRPAVVAL